MVCEPMLVPWMLASMPAKGCLPVNLATTPRGGPTGEIAGRDTGPRRGNRARQPVPPAGGGVVGSMVAVGETGGVVGELFGGGDVFVGSGVGVDEGVGLVVVVAVPVAVGRVGPVGYVE